MSPVCLCDNKSGKGLKIQLLLHRNTKHVSSTSFEKAQLHLRVHIQERECSKYLLASSLSVHTCEQGHLKLNQYRFWLQLQPSSGIRGHQH